MGDTDAGRNVASIDRAADDQPAPSGRPSRRTVLLGAGAVGAAAAAAALAACSSDSKPAGSTPTKAAAGPLAKTSDIPVGGGKIFTSPQVVVTQPTAGTFKAFTSICTHQGCPVTQISNGLIMCPCHGSEYSITDGSVKRAAVTGQAGLAAEPITVANGEISLT
jgi:nitrite reductase/ring-hydroxylating ferredoxin subunit